MILEKKKREKSINSKGKGDRFERKIFNLFKKHWGVTAYRTPGSGAFTKRQVSKAMKNAAAGDVVIEEIPDLLLECKNYYSLHFTEWFKPKKKVTDQTIWSFWQKLLAESIELKKVPMLICKEENSPIVAIMENRHITIIESYSGAIGTYIQLTDEITGIYLCAFAFQELLDMDLEMIQFIVKEIQE